MGYKADDSSEGLSIEETNKIRIRLGLKPLIEETGCVDSREYEIECNTAGERKRRLAKERREALIRRISREKEVASRSRKLSGFTLADDPNWVSENISEWAKKHAQRVDEKKAEISNAKKAFELEQQKRALELSKVDNLKGLKILHKLENLSEGQHILTLKDENILALEDTGDTLENVNLTEKEKYQEGLSSLRAAQSNSYDEDELGNKTGLLRKYDYDLGESSNEAIILGSRGKVDLNGHIEGKNPKNIQGKVVESLEYAPLREASTYLGPDEIKIFKKKSNVKKKGLRVARTHAPEDSHPQDVLDVLKEKNDGTDNDHGHRSKLHDKSEVAAEVVSTQNNVSNKCAPVEKVIDYSQSNSKVDITGMNFIDDEDVQRALSTLRKATVIKAKIQAPSQIADDTKATQPNDPPTVESKGFVFSASTDFAKNVSIKPRIKPKEQPAPKVVPEVPRPQSEDISIILDRLESRKQEIGSKSGWVEVTEDGKRALPRDDVSVQSDKSSSEHDETDTNLAAGGGALEEEPIISNGIGSAVTLLKQKGEIREPTAEEIEREKRILNKELWLAEKKLNLRLSQPEVKSGKEGSKKRHKKGYKGDSENQRLKEERELRKVKREKIALVLDQYKNYNPEVNLEYFDEFGRRLDQKEAFRQLSHKFHGKSSGKIKTERRLRKIQDELSTIPRSL